MKIQAVNFNNLNFGKSKNYRRTFDENQGNKTNYSNPYASEPKNKPQRTWKEVEHYLLHCRGMHKDMVHDYMIAHLDELGLI